MKTTIKSLFITVIALLVYVGSYCQSSKLAVLHNGVSTIYTSLNSAIAGAQSGDTIYLPGGYIPASGNPVVVNKPLTIIGVGHHPDSTAATGTTIIANNLSFNSGADGSRMTGCVIQNLYFGWTGSANVNNIIFSRCYIGSLHACMYGCTSTASNILFTEDVIMSSSDGSFGSVLYEKCIIQEPFYPTSAVYNNNVFISNIYFPFVNSILNNNIFINTGNSGYTINLNGSQNTYTNNLFCAGSTAMAAVITGNNVCTNNITGQLISGTFINMPNWSFSYSNNYHLKSTSPGKNAGTDGTDLGIYGTQYPAKEGAVPFNPHISYKNIGTTVSPTGMLNVDVKVSAQDR